MTTEEKINRIYDILIEIHEKDGSAEGGLLHQCKTRPR
jgi:hypothetical protein